MKNRELIDVLIVEDDEWLAESFSRALKNSGFNEKVCHDVVEAISLIDDLKPKAIILDMLLTGTTAFVLMHELQSYEDTCKIPIILCTNIASDMSLNDLKPYGVVKILDKSRMHPSDLVAAVKVVL